MVELRRFEVYFESIRHGLGCPYRKAEALRVQAKKQRKREAQVAEAKRETDCLRRVLLELRDRIDRALDEGTFS